MKNNWLNQLRRLGLVLLLSLLALPAALAQTSSTADSPEMADALRQSGKIYVVVLVILLILGGLLAYLIRLDGKVSRWSANCGKRLEILCLSCRQAFNLTCKSSFQTDFCNH
jgi:hypothetical protein